MPKKVVSRLGIKRKEEIMSRHKKIDEIIGNLGDLITKSDSNEGVQELLRFCRKIKRWRPNPLIPLVNSIVKKVNEFRKFPVRRDVEYLLRKKDGINSLWSKYKNTGGSNHE